VTEIVDVDENGDVVSVTEIVEVLDVVDEDTEVLIPAAPVVEDSPWSPPVWAADVPVLTDLPEPEPQPEPAPVFENSRLSAHVLDTAKGAPAVGVAVALLEQPEDNIGSWIPLALGVSDAAGRIGQLSDGPLQPGIYRLLVESGAYWQDQGVTGFYPEIVVTFEVAEDAHLHIPLLLSPFGFSTYRGV